ncbi:MAG: YbaK/EbsC family protein [Sneathiella sp.]
MPISKTLKRYLSDRHAAYDTLAHQLTTSSSQTAEEAHIPGSRLIKAIVVKGSKGFKVALLPASHHLRLNKLREVLSEKVHFANQDEISDLFRDCSEGAIPALGMAYGLDVIVDTNIVNSGDLYFEGGDHKTLVHLQAETMDQLLQNAKQGAISHHDKKPTARNGYRYSHC